MLKKKNIIKDYLWCLDEKRQQLSFKNFKNFVTSNKARSKRRQNKKKK